jgi:hypothetical protein
LLSFKIVFIEAIEVINDVPILCKSAFEGLYLAAKPRKFASP